MIPEWLLVALYFHGISLGYFIAWIKYRKPKLNYRDIIDEQSDCGC